jgi:sulfonate transport system permease protein
MGNFLKKGVNWLGLGVIVALVVVWQVLVSTRVVSYSSLPGPVDIWRGFQDLTGPADGGLGQALSHTVRVALLSWVIGAALGGVVGLLLGLNQTVAAWGNSTVDLLRSLPVVALIPIAILLWGTGDQAEIILGAYAALWPMLVNTVGGVRSVTPRLRDVAQTLGLSRGRTVTKIVLPATGSAMLVGARLALAGTLVICVVSEMLGLQSGVGNQLVLEQSAQQPARMWVYVLTAGVLGVIVNAGLIKLFRLLLPGVALVAERNNGR